MAAGEYVPTEEGFARADLTAAERRLADAWAADVDASASAAIDADEVEETAKDQLMDLATALSSAALIEEESSDESEGQAEEDAVEEPEDVLFDSDGEEIVAAEFTDAVPVRPDGGLATPPATVVASEEEAAAADTDDDDDDDDDDNVVDDDDNDSNEDDVPDLIDLWNDDAGAEADGTESDDSGEDDEEVDISDLRAELLAVAEEV